MEGVEGKEFLVAMQDEEGLEKAIKKATKDVLRRTGGAGFPLLSGGCGITSLEAVKRGVERGGATALVYHKDLPTDICSEVEVEEWLRKRRSGVEERVIIADEHVSRGWECSHVLVIDDGSGMGLENLVMRTVGYCALVKYVI